MARGQEGTSYVTAGGSRKAISLGGILNVQNLSAVTPSVTTGADVILATYTMPLNVLNATLKGLRIKAWGQFLNVGAAATILKIKIAGNLIASIHNNSTAATLPCFAEAVIFRTTQTNTIAMGNGQWADASTNVARPSQQQFSTPVLTMSGTLAITLEVNQAVASAFQPEALLVELLTEGSPE